MGARDELMAASLQANVSMHTVSGMDASIVRITEAIELNKKLELFAEIPKAERLAKEIALRDAYRMLRAATADGSEALDNKTHIERSITLLTTALKEANEMGLTL